jgi:hypothetical protein
LLEKKQTKEKIKMETITKNKAIAIIKQHGNFDEINDFFKTYGKKEIYKVKHLKDWLGY